MVNPRDAAENEEEEDKEDKEDEEEEAEEERPKHSHTDIPKKLPTPTPIVPHSH